MKKKILLALSFVLTLSLNNIRGQENNSTEELLELSLEELMNIEVYATSRTQGQASNTAPATVRVVTAEQIEMRGYQSLLDLFYDMPEVKVDYGVDPRWMNDITIRGLRGMDKFIILLDGVKISSPTNDIISVMENYPLNFAQQVEVVFGPASALYGADAFAGVINIITKKAEKNHNTEGSASGGMYNTVTSSFYHSNKINENFTYTVGGQYYYDQQPDLAKYYEKEYLGMDEELKTGTFNTIFGPITPKSPVDDEKAHPLNAYGVFAGLNYKNLSFNYFGNHAQNPSTMANSPHNAVYNLEQKFGHYINMGTVCYNPKINNIQSITTLNYSRYDLDNESNFRNIWTNMEPAYLFAYGYMLKGEQLFSIPIKDKINVTLGGTYENYTSMPRSNNLQDPVSGSKPDGIIVNSITSLNPDGIDANLIKVDYYNLGGIAQIEYQPIEKMTLTIGGRIDHDKRFGTTVNPRLGIVVQPSSKYSIKALYGSAFLAPSPQNMYDRYGTFNTDDNGLTYYSFFFQMPNEDLEPQKVETIEASFSALINQKLNFSLAGYLSSVTNLINPITDTNVINKLYPSKTYEGFPIYSMQVNGNLGESMIYGASVIGNYLERFNEDMRLNLYLALSYIDGVTDIDEGGPIEERNLPGISNYTIKGGIDFQFKALTISPRIINMSKQRTFNAASVKPNDLKQYQEINGFTLVNLNINYKVLKNLMIFGTVKNLSNIRYRNINIGAAPEAIGAGSAAVEFAEGAPQNPIRAIGGIKIVF